MVAQDAHRFDFARQKIEVVILKEPAERVAIGVAFQNDTAREFVGGNYQRAIFNPDVEFGIGERKPAFDIGKGVGASEHAARLIAQSGKENMLTAEGANSGLVQLYDNNRFAGSDG
jgi:hypothetical protein